MTRTNPVRLSTWPTLLILAALSAVDSSPVHGQEVAKLKVSDKPLFSIAYSPDGKQLALGDEAGEVSLWNVQTATKSQSFSLGVDVVYAVAFSPDGKLLGAAGIHIDDNARQISGAFRIWDLETRSIKYQQTFPKTGIYSIAFSQSGNTFAVAGKGAPGSGRSGILKMWRTDTGEAFMPEVAKRGDLNTKVAFGPDGESVFSGTDGGVKLWDINKPKNYPKLLRNSINKHMDFCLSPDGKHLVNVGYSTVGFYDVPKHKSLGELYLKNFRYMVTSCDFSPDGQLVVIGSHNPRAQVGIVDFQKQEMIAMFEGHQKGVLAVAYSPDNKHVASASEDGTAIIWDALARPSKFWVDGSDPWPGDKLWMTRSNDGHMDLTDVRGREGKFVTLKDLKDVRSVQLTIHRLKDVNFKKMKQIPRLERLRLVSESVGMVKYLDELPHLESLDLTKIPVADHDLEWLSSLSNLKELHLEGTRLGDRQLVNLITDKGLEHLAPLKNLKVLKISANRVSTLGVPHLQPLEALEELDLGLTSVGYGGDVDLGKKPALVKLRLNKASDATLKKIAEYQNLEFLEFKGDRTTEAGLIELAALPKLKDLRISDYWMPMPAAEYVRALPKMPEGERKIYSQVRILGLQRKNLSEHERLLNDYQTKMPILIGGIRDPFERTQRAQELIKRTQETRDEIAKSRKAISTLAREIISSSKVVFGDQKERVATVKAAVEAFSGMKFADTDPLQADIAPREKKYNTNSIGMKFVEVPAGQFQRSNPPERQRNLLPGQSKPAQHNVSISRPYWLGVTEVTREQFEKVTGEEPSSVGKIALNAFDRNPREGKLIGENLPAHNISWNDAARFCHLLSQMPEEKAAKRRYRLPTEAEWEYACRAGTKTTYSFGEEGDLTLKEANWKREVNEFVQIMGAPTTVGSYTPNPFGLYDMHGNVAEWCVDNPASYPEKAVIDPVHFNSSSSRMVRGGSFNDSYHHAGSSVRSYLPGDIRFPKTGFRVVLVMDPQPLDESIFEILDIEKQARLKQIQSIRSRIEEATKKINEHPDWYYSYDDRADEYVKLANLDIDPVQHLKLAIQDYQRGLDRMAKEPKATTLLKYVQERFAETWLKLGNRHQAAGQEDAAREAWRNSLTRINEAFASFEKYILPEMKRDYRNKPEQEHLNRTVSLAQLHQIRSHVHERLGDLNAAMADIDQCVANRPNDSRYRKERIRLSVQLQNYEKALEDYNTLVKDQEAYLMSIAKENRSPDRFDKQAKLYLADLLDERAKIHDKLQHADEAAKDRERAMKIRQE